MSSHGSPTLVLELRQMRGQRLAAISLMALAGLAPLLILGSVGLALAVLLVALGLSVLAMGFRRAGWLGGTRSVVRAIWRSDGTWQLTMASNAEVEARLLPASRMSPVAIWLRWSIEPAPAPGSMHSPRTRTLLLLPGDLSRPDFRRLLVRLRLDRSECAAPTAAQANS